MFTQQAGMGSWLALDSKSRIQGNFLPALAFIFLFLGASTMGQAERHLSSARSIIVSAALEAQSAVTVKSNAFKNNEPIPIKYTGEGQDVSPDLSWGPAPAGTKEWFLICEDPDAPMATPFVHWIVASIPATITGFAEAAVPRGLTQGKNSFGTRNYRGPMPPKGHGTHHYHFQLLALSKPLSVSPDSGREALLKALESDVLGYGELVGIYERR